MNSGYEIFLVFGFLAVVLLLEGVFVLWSDTRSPEVQRVRRRLRMISAGDPGQADASLLKQRLLSSTPELERVLLMIPKIGHLDRLLLQAGARMNVLNVLTLCALAGSAGLLLGIVLGWAWQFCVLMALAAMAAPVLWLVWLRTRRIEKINEQLPEVMDLISRALRAGHAFSATLSMVGNEAQEPIAAEFKTTFDEINFGMSTKGALLNLATRVPIPDMRYFVMAVLIQLETGGNLAELLTMLGGLIRSRYKLVGNIKTLAAEGKFSAYILVALPFFLAAMLQIINPGYMEILLTDPMGMKLVYGALILMVFGVFVMWRIIKIHI
jgi:tight adherence protein B